MRYIRRSEGAGHHGPRKRSDFYSQRPAEHSTPPNGPEPPPAVFHCFAEFLRDLPLESISVIALTRYWQLSVEERQVLRERLGFSNEEMLLWVNPPDAISGEEEAKSAERTDPPAP